MQTSGETGESLATNLGTEKRTKKRQRKAKRNQQPVPKPDHHVLDSEDKELRRDIRNGSILVNLNDEDNAYLQGIVQSHQSNIIEPWFLVMNHHCPLQPTKTISMVVRGTEWQCYTQQ